MGGAASGHHILYMTWSNGVMNSDSRTMAMVNMNYMLRSQKASQRKCSNQHCRRIHDKCVMWPNLNFAQFLLLKLKELYQLATVGWPMQPDEYGQKSVMGSQVIMVR